MVEYAKQPTRDYPINHRNKQEFFGTLVYEKKYRVCSL